jgi:SAM-dependent methyltransferase
VRAEPVAFLGRRRRLTLVGLVSGAEVHIRRACGGGAVVSDSVSDRAVHWDGVYGRLDEDVLSWFEPEPACSLGLLDLAGVARTDPIIDVGAGASRLVDALVARDYADVTALDVSDAGLAQARRRLADSAAQVQWVVADLLSWRPARRYRVWHDRAVFHFLTDPADRVRYRDVLDRALMPDGRIVIGTFAADGPEQCSGLPTVRYSPQELTAALGPNVEPLGQRRELHRTPSGGVQPFTWLALRRL